MPFTKKCFILYLSLLATTVGGFDLPKTSPRTKGSFRISRTGRDHLTVIEAGDINVATRPTEKTSSRTQIDEKVLRELERCESGTAARRVLERALFFEEDNESAKQPLFGSIQIPGGLSDRSISDGDLAIQTRVRNKKYGIFDLIDTNGDRDADRASAAVFGTFVASSLSAIVANENLPGPEIFRFVVVWILSFAPLGLVGLGIGSTEKLQAFLVSVQRQIFPVYRKRMVQHEAGHLLMAHLLGYPIAGYSTNAVKNAVEFYPLSDKDVGKDKAQMLGFDRKTFRADDNPQKKTRPRTNDAPFFSPEGSGMEELETQSVFRNAKDYRENPFLKIATEDQPRNSWPYRGFDHGTVDKLAVVSCAGVCAEIISFGYAEGGLADINQLQQILANAEPELSERDKENRIRFAMGYTMTQLRLHLGCLDQLSEVMNRGGSVAECVSVIESCTNVSGTNGVFGDDYELRRRKEMKSSALGIFEKLLLSPKDIDAEEDRMVQGAGGGFRKEKPNFLNISGDDPLYIAGGIACIFLAYATSGGVSLH
mmetsp:Transcript_8367/g.18051  ORF Transcript_8367/g.18051 Transcript_8367/m.18051 type:complete len:539 (+) Transcript_8367:181-1797(+)|eukprot:CAMPEP_0168182480 /NCGR_PEP_ID=MMETSP0139_2-20121125/11917_1 /TAXON_ID=44445 /ORGANISM="Pseudo-nitzschia australis, Strain 10249 10 AB" /LENGTH=538 /DNA_ID=CAMNT_0008103415 /DNA_START=127 /DNA_END=1743 /DNA_ORIENTATION=+